MVSWCSGSTQDSESCNPSSNLGETNFLFLKSGLLEWIIVLFSFSFEFGASIAILFKDDRVHFLQIVGDLVPLGQAGLKGLFRVWREEDGRFGEGDEEGCLGGLRGVWGGDEFLPEPAAEEASLPREEEISGLAGGGSREDFGGEGGNSTAGI